MKFFLLFFFPCFIFSHFVFAQKPSTEIPTDTIEGTSTDTSIIYIIKKPPVMIREKVEIQREKRKKYYYLSLSAGGFMYSERMKGRSGYEEYIEKVKDLTRPLPGYSLEIFLRRAPEKTITGLTVSHHHFSQEFNYTDTIGRFHRLSNDFNYGNIGIHIGRWVNKGKKISFQYHGGLIIDHFVSAQGLILNSADEKTVLRLNRVIHYKKYSASINIGFSTLLALKKSFLEIEPYITLSPFSATTKKENFTVTRNLIGIKIALINPLF